MSPDMLALDLLLRGIGLFYVVAAIVLMRQVTMNALLDAMISGITLKPVPRVERLRGCWHAAGAVTVFASGVFLLLLSDLAVPAFLLGAVSQAVFFGYVAPRWLDPQDEPDENGRRQAINAFLLYAAVTAAVLWAGYAGRLSAWHAQPWWLLAAAAAVIGSFALHAWRRLFPRLGAGGGEGDDDRFAEAIDPPKRIRLMARPTRMPLADDDTGEHLVFEVRERLFSEGLMADVQAWDDRFQETVPVGGIRGGGFSDPEEAARFDAEGRALAARLDAAYADGEVVYAPPGTPFPNAPERRRTHPDRVKLFAEYGTTGLWTLDEDDYGPIDPDVLPISKALSGDILAWVVDYERSLDWAAEPVEICRWSEEERAAHEERGRQLAVRLARELAAAGRGHVMVYAHRGDAGVVEVRADDRIDGDPAAAPG